MTVESIKHKHNKRAFIPSVSEAGQETDNQIVKEKKSIKMVRNPIVQRGQDPELYWMNKYGADDTEKFSEVDIRSLYRIEHISPEMLIQKLYKIKEIPAEQLSLMDLFGNSINIDELEKVGEYYKHQDNWTNRMILGDSQLVMTSLLEREGLAGKVQTIFFDPPYGIKYGSNWQIKLNNKNVTDGKDEHLSGEPEQIKAYRDTWELGIHSYLSYLRDRLLVAQKLLTESGSCFVQISDENVHLVRCLMDEVFGSANFVSLISFSTTSGFESKTISRAGDYILWYAKDIETVKYRQLYLEKQDDTSGYNKIELENGERRSLTKEEKENSLLIPKNSKIYSSGALFSPGESPEGSKSFIFKNKEYKPSSGHWKTTLKGLEKLTQLNRIEVSGNTIRYVRYFNDFPLVPINNIWKDTQTFMDKYYVVQTSQKIIQRCLLMTTDPGDLVLDPTCGSGTSAYVAEQWGRR
ncbi:site-specific DNA-methyltransferase, partial [Candidatus Dependentiae bacterium]|nr:site-specific DNA-methyltransferase [Candidatus Dependentiae bacterium]